MNAADDALERRIVTVLFADLVGFTSLSEAFDAEDIAAIQDRYFAAVRDTIGRYGGRVEKFIGDAAMAAFGVPRTHDDDAQRAVRAGMALVNAVQLLGVELGLDDDALRLRVGINTGEAVVAAGGADDGRVTGDTVNTAARFQTAAAPGSVLIGESTSLAVADIAELGEVVLLELKGKAQAVPARVVNSLLAQPSREKAMGALRAPIVGRVAELAEIAAALDRATKGATERWLVVAPPGVGKSRLLAEVALTASARPDVVTLRGRARAGSVAPFEPIAELLRAALSSADPAAAPDALVAAARTQGAAESRARVIARMCAGLLSQAPGEDPGGGKAEDRDALFAGWCDGLDALAASRTQVWLIEDIHWAAADLLAFVDYATQRAVPAGRLIIATARPSVLETSPSWSEDDADGGRHVLRLDTLADSNAHELVTALVGDALPDSLVERIVARSDGNCLFIEELLRTWVSVGTLVADGEAGWLLAVPADEVSLPHSVQAIYVAQLDDLPADARRLARRASVCGRRFPVDAIAALDASTDGLAPLHRRDLVIGPLTEPLLGDAYAYRHALLRDAGYASLARAERARLHVRIARWLEQAAGEHSAEVAGQIAGHYSTALESAPGLAATIDKELDRESARRQAAKWFELAGDAALAIAAHDEARELFRRAVDLTSDDGNVDVARRWRRLGEATAFAADMTEGAFDYHQSIAHFRAAVAEARDETAVTGLAESGALLADVWHQQLRFAEARELTDQLVQELPDASPSARARLLIARAVAERGAQGPTDAAERDLVEAARLANLTQDRRLKLLARTSLATLHAETGEVDMTEWLAIGDEATALGEPRIAAESLITAGMQFIDDTPRDVGGALEKARDITVAYGLTELGAWILYTEAETFFADGRWDLALDRAVAAIDLAQANDYLRVAVRCIHVAVPIAGARGDRSVLERAANWYHALEGRFEFPDSPYARVIRPAQDLELADAGLWPPYMPGVEACFDGFAGDPSGPSWAAGLDRVLRAWVVSGELDGAQRALDALAGFIRANTQVTHLGRGTFELMSARVAAARGDHERAAAAATEALGNFRISDAPWWMAKAIRLLERSGAADPTLIAEVEDIERRLGCARPTA